MPLTTYILPISWIPDPDYINSHQGIHYLAWRIGIDEKNQTAQWLIEPVRDTPEPLANLLPNIADYSEAELLEDTNKYGQTRSVQTKETIDAVQDDFLAEVAIATASVIAGYR